MAKRTSLMLSTGILIVMGYVLYTAQPLSKGEAQRNRITKFPSQTDTRVEFSAKQNNLISKSKRPVITKPNEPKYAARDKKEIAIQLTEANFENNVMKCFRGQNCVFKGSPEKLYERFRAEGNNQGNDYLISYLRSKLRDSKYRELYKDIVWRMIHDLYSPEETPFQKAAYFNYLGDLEKSLSLYLELEKRIESGEVLSSAPKLNIANTYYDLKRYKSALPYYRQALNEFSSGKVQSVSPGKNSMIAFIRKRISQIQEKLAN